MRLSNSSANTARRSSGLRPPAAHQFARTGCTACDRQQLRRLPSLSIKPTRALLPMRCLPDWSAGLRHGAFPLFIAPCRRPALRFMESHHGVCAAHWDHEPTRPGARRRRPRRHATQSWTRTTTTTGTWTQFRAIEWPLSVAWSGFRSQGAPTQNRCCSPRIRSRCDTGTGEAMSRSPMVFSARSSNFSFTPATKTTPSSRAA